METNDDRKILEFLMDDSTWQQKDIKKPIEKKKLQENKIEKETEIPKVTETIVKKEVIKHDRLPQIKTVKHETKEEPEAYEKAFGEVDYAILKSVSYGIKKIPDISKVLQIRANVIEKHIFKLIKEGYLKYFQFCVLTTRGSNTIQEYEQTNPEDIWKPIDDFIMTVIEGKKEFNLKIQKAIDIVLLISMIILIILIIYFGILT